MLKILLVDDHKAFRKEFMRLPFIKGNSDFEISFEANDGREALKIAEENSVDIIISDIRMPVMNGLELLHNLNLKEIHPVFIILSEYGTFEYAQQALNLGAFGYLTKPVNNDDVNAILTKVKNELSGETIPLITTENIELLVLKMLENSPATEDIAKSVFSNINAHSKTHELLRFADQLMGSVKNKLYDYVPWLFPFISQKLFVIEEQDLINRDCPQLLQDKICYIQSEINKFGFSLSPSSKTESIQGICIFILTNIMNPELNSTYVADRFFFNKTYLSQLFKEKMSIPMIKFITYAKMEYARVQLENKDTRISELSTTLNFENPDYFSSIFKKTYGCSPAAYQKKIRQPTQD